jgi:Domain of unknown function (DUF1929)
MANNINVATTNRNVNASLNADINIEGVVPKYGNWIEEFNHDPLETDPGAAFPGIEYLLEYKFPDTFNAIHMSLIPKGPNKGKLMVWDNALVLAKIPSLDMSGDYWAMQVWAIVDPDADAAVRFQNFLFPLGKIEKDPGDPTNTALWKLPNLFCAGHAWTPNGDLLVAGGMRWDLAFLQYADNKTFMWCPSLPIGVHVTDNPLSSLLTGGHYTGAYGAWIQGPTLDYNRYYPTVNVTKQLSRTSSKHVALVLGGSEDLAEANQTYTYNAAWNKYEGLVINSAPVWSPSPSTGLTKDNVAGVTSWNGPANVPGNTPFEDSLYFYARTYWLNSGELFMAGMVHRSASLGDHDAAPGVWSTSKGHNNVTGLLNEFRYYGTSVQLQNFEGYEDVIYRIGGAQIPPFIVWDGITEREFDSKTVERINLPGSPTQQWQAAPSLAIPRQMVNSVVLPDGSILVMGGQDWQPTTEPAAPMEIGPHLGIAHEDFIYVTAPELLMPGASKWIIADWAKGSTPRDYHSTIVLLPDGRIFVGGGEARHHDGGGYDYEIYEPHYLRPQLGSDYVPVRPSSLVIKDNTGVALTPDADGTYVLSYGTTYRVSCATLPQYRKISQATMTPVSSITHHADVNIKLRFLNCTNLSDTEVQFTTPANQNQWQKGYHFLWILTDTGIPGEAIWVKF